MSSSTTALFPHATCRVRYTRPAEGSLPSIRSASTAAALPVTPCMATTPMLLGAASRRTKSNSIEARSAATRRPTQAQARRRRRRQCVCRPCQLLDCFRERSGDREGGYFAAYAYLFNSTVPATMQTMESSAAYAKFGRRSSTDDSREHQQGRVRGRVVRRLVSSPLSFCRARSLPATAPAASNSTSDRLWFHDPGKQQPDHGNPE